MNDIYNAVVKFFEENGIKDYSIEVIDVPLLNGYKIKLKFKINNKTKDFGIIMGLKDLKHFKDSLDETLNSILRYKLKDIIFE